MSTQRKPRILFLFSDTGGGHRSSCEAIIEAMHDEFGCAVETEMLDFLRDYYPWPYSFLPTLYRESVKFPRLYGRFWHSINTPKRTKLLMDSNRANPMLLRRHIDMLAAHPADLVVSTHYMSLPPTVWMKRDIRPKTAVVVTDLVSTHATWFRPAIDHYIVPTEAARQHALAHDIPEQNVELIGLPVADRFARRCDSKEALRERFGWSQGRPIVLLMGGGEGMGPLAENAQAIAQSGLDLSLVIVTGRNDKLRSQLEAIQWPLPVHIYGFEREMHLFMQASDVLVTKAGPSSICEGLNAGLPIILYDRLPGQEEGNVTWLIENGAGCFAPEPQLVVKTLRDWLAGSAELDTVTRNASQLARPEAARQIARRLVAMVNSEPIGA